LKIRGIIKYEDSRKTLTEKIKAMAFEDKAF
jgi:hypothetical protein